jgi:hypothetical protein
VGATGGAEARTPTCCLDGAQAPIGRSLAGSLNTSDIAPVQARLSRPGSLPLADARDAARTSLLRDRGFPGMKTIRTVGVGGV